VNRTRWIQLAFLAVAGGLLAAAGLLHEPLRARSAAEELALPGVQEQHPEVQMLMMTSGGLRALAVNYLWIRSQLLHDAGRHYDAYQLGELICMLQPKFPAVWDFHSWQMAWNISVTKDDPQQRWRCVYNGIMLLRDRGIPYNPKAIMLYRSLAWIFFSKMGDRIDEMHMAYKRRWAQKMQRLLSTPPRESVTATVEAFRPIAEAPLDKRPGRQGRELIQADQLAALRAGDAKLDAYVRRLAEAGVEVGWGLLDAYNRFSRDYAVLAAWAVPPPEPASDSPDRPVFEAINDADFAEQRAALLAFTRAQLLWNVYKMDPEWMFQLMDGTYLEQYTRDMEEELRPRDTRLPLDWRLVWPHGLYWSSYGDAHAEQADEGALDRLNNRRTILNSLKDMARVGTYTVRENPLMLHADWRLPDPLPWRLPRIGEYPNWHYYVPTHVLHHAFATEYVAERNRQAERPIAFEDNKLKGGHLNWIAESILMLWTRGEDDAAARLLAYAKQRYKMRGEEWDAQSVEAFARRRFRSHEQEGGEAPRRDVVLPLIDAALERALMALLAGQTDAFNENVEVARFYHDSYNRSTPERNYLPPLRWLVENVATVLIREPGALGYGLDWKQRVNLYDALGSAAPDVQRVVYFRISQPTSPLRGWYARQGRAFDEYFEQPSGYPAWLAGYLERQRREQFRRMGPAAGP